jgi:hypothetical protein
MESKRSVFEILNEINVNEHTEQKNGLTYLSWAWAWGTLKKHFPDATYTVYENAQGLNYHTDGRTCWVKTGVTVEGIENIEYLPVMDYANKSIPTERVTSFDVNKAIQRSLTKAVARHGLGLYIYAGEDLPEQEAAKAREEASKPTRAQIINQFCKDHGLTQEAFGNYKRGAVTSKIIPDKMVNSLTEDEFAALLSFVEANCK